MNLWIIKLFFFKSELAQTIFCLASTKIEIDKEVPQDAVRRERSDSFQIYLGQAVLGWRSTGLQWRLTLLYHEFKPVKKATLFIKI